MPFFTTVIDRELAGNRSDIHAAPSRGTLCRLICSSVE
jgi:hypothetical protein